MTAKVKSLVWLRGSRETSVGSKGGEAGTTDLLPPMSGVRILPSAITL